MNALNQFRKNITQKLTKSCTNKFQNIDFKGVKSILIIRPNHRLGNILLITPLVEEVVTHFPNAQIDLFVKGQVSQIIFENHPKVNEIFSLPKKHFKQLHLYLLTWFKLLFKKYDLVINAHEASSSGRLATKLVNSKCKFFGFSNQNNYEIENDYKHIAKQIIYSFRGYLLNLQPNLVFQPISKITMPLSDAELESGKEKLSLLFKNDKPTICFFTFATGSKCYDKVFWNEFYQKMKIAFEPRFNLLEILPVENCSQIDFISENFYSKDVREIASLLHHTVLFIGADSGMMHLASSATTTLGLFKVTSPIKYQPYGGSNLGLFTEDLEINDIIDKVKSIVEL